MAQVPAAELMLGLDYEARLAALLDEFRIARNAAKRWVYMGIAWVFLALGVAGYFVPGIPGTINLIVALWFFAESNERMYRWMLTNRYFGRQLVDYKSGLGIPRVIKIVAVASITLFGGWSLYVVDPLWVRIIIAALMVYGIAFVLTRPTRERILAEFTFD